MTLGEDKNGWKLMTRINNVSMDYPLGLEAGVWYCFSLYIILKFFKAAALEFSNSPTQILMIFLSRETVGRVTQTKYFLEMTVLAKVAKNFFFYLCGSDFSYCFSDILLPSLPMHLIKQP